MSEVIELHVRHCVDGAMNPGDVRAVPPDGGVVGRTDDCDVVFPSATVSRRHARLLPVEGAWAVEPLTTGNGTFVDGRPVAERQPVGAGQRVQFGGVVVDVVVSAMTRPVLQPIEEGMGEPLLSATWDAGHCTIRCAGRLLALEPQPARALAALIERPNEPVHRWDILERAGADANLDRCMSKVRKALREAMDAGILPRDAVQQAIRTTRATADATATDDDQLMRQLIEARRGFGYVLALLPDQVRVAHQ